MIESKCPKCHAGVSTPDLTVCKVINCPKCNESLRAVSVEFKTVAQLQKESVAKDKSEAARIAHQRSARQAEIARRLQESHEWVYEQGRRVRHGYFEYVVNSSEWTKCKKKKHLFLLINISITNIDDEAQRLPIMELVDSEANFYYSDFTHRQKDNGDALEGLTPGGTITLDIAFNVPQENGYSLLLGDTLWEVTDYRAVILTPNV
ncbi:MAG: DUF4352 domain-containing protein [Phycisphaerae bacterium]|nr:DUF4352 domain-containing protein [Phycisphaerae bacterium]